MTDDLIISADSSRRCASACEQFVSDLAELLPSISALEFSAGFGTLPSGIALARKYSDLTHGPEGSLSSVLAAHITAVTNLREAFLEAGRGYQATEDDSTSRISRSGPR
ncbi:hypothetical protein HQ325_15770 [Rhodococcus sp. BP-349]|uniref:hypothetical protein n=1 Tax=unclassified Rhodococcus (in: high G+C Gram-positive bacteria) TaxID=192944 RepID=UPI001C9B2996|nr:MULTISPECIES: hypothetical protein [unclassified Rhodococcus (in: high G+C Gram-positive bacteria)]MBY6540134.1 hypothetical protein [Rhodococcus sp. BP-363]MBY6543538.1 hypothetical protein [Rhodococcus sp. BP-369]MBY6562768.1 hypothetical protein [Rhodococcus sp. BP-370]MBY6577060.1 hypothetical protein [Rhodococcus sp. BP-364]MBY6586361.1 hypothetical protein [Rhodococcus sp. BP-358]